MTSHSRCVVTSWGKELQLTAALPIEEGEVIVAEVPLVSVRDASPRYATYAWDLVDKVLSKTELTQRYYALRLKVTKFPLDMEDQRIIRELARKHRCTREMVKTLYFGICANNIGFDDAHDEIIGHGIYPVISRANHSCRPNARCRTGNVDAEEVTLVAIRNIEMGEGVAWNYVDVPDFNNADYEQRNFTLMRVFRFVCRCERCQEEVPPELANHPNLTRYFDSLVSDHARVERQAM